MKQNLKPEHPMEVFTGIKTFKIVQKSLNKDNLYGCVEFPKSLLSIDPSQCIEDYKGTLLHEICHIGYGQAQEALLCGFQIYGVE